MREEERRPTSYTWEGGRKEGRKEGGRRKEGRREKEGGTEEGRKEGGKEREGLKTRVGSTLGVSIIVYTCSLIFSGHCTILMLKISPN